MKIFLSFHRFSKEREDFWLGNDNIFGLSNQQLYSLRVDLQDVEGNKRYAMYDTFWIEDENRKYTLHVIGYSGNAGDSLENIHNNRRFSTKDQDNDDDIKTNCAETYKGAWWYGACHVSNLNGLYLNGKHETYADGVNWNTWKGYYESLVLTEMKIRSKNFRKQSSRMR
ncbi:techylectin-5A [Caerostris extrusa]|uniref:Techylectin-5A n=1 Tax=Caerostris extrusa TaxID=172846 RepID=A0AAV4TY83_CAEEX|nr:techylectin-5A [Caerostris extrusa]